MIKRAVMTTLLIVLVLLAVLILMREPVNDADWQEAYRVLPTVSIDGDRIEVGNYRDFRYKADGSIRQRTYTNEVFFLSQLQDVWYGISHFADNGMAHVFLSFSFSNDKYLVVSIEARLKQADDGYDPVKGLFRHFTQTIVLGSEQDVIGLRTHIRKEEMYLYELDISALTARSLLLNYLAKAERFNTMPAFYNSVLDNCMTGLLRESTPMRNVLQWIDYRILLPGYSDRLAYELGLIGTNEPFSIKQKNALVLTQGYSVDASDFSMKIRGESGPEADEDS